ncbi:MAG: DUF2127 domain-containing protein [Cyanobacteria bacterium J06626_4]
MSYPRQLSLLTKILVIKKMIFGGLMLAISAVCLLGWGYYDALSQFADSYLLTAEYDFMRWLIEHLVSTQPKVLIKIAELTGVYGLVIETAAIGLWLGLTWAEPLFILLVAALIPLEVFEVWHHPSPTKVLFFAINVFIVGFLTRRWLSELNADKETAIARS